MRQITGKLGLCDRCGTKRKRRRRFISRLLFQKVKIDRAGIQARAGAGFQTSQRKSQALVVFGEAVGGKLASATGRKLPQADA
jgi:hypothetical protein